MKQIMEHKNMLSSSEEDSNESYFLMALTYVCGYFFFNFMTWCTCPFVLFTVIY